VTTRVEVMGGDRAKMNVAILLPSSATDAARMDRSTM
jgi:hypothetical protein